MCSRVWATSGNGSIQYVSVTKDRLQETLEFVREALYKDENICNSVDLPNHPEAIPELDIFTLTCLKDGLSIIAIDTTTDEVVGCIGNKICVKEDGEKSLHDICSCKNPYARSVIQVMDALYRSANLFEYLQTDCYWDVVFACVSPQYRKKGVLQKLSDINFNNGMMLLKQEQNIRVPLDDQPFPLHPLPTAGVIFATSLFSGRVAERMGIPKILTLDLNNDESLHHLLVKPLDPICVYSISAKELNLKCNL